jgi:hypothetical protein
VVILICFHGIGLGSTVELFLLFLSVSLNQPRNSSVAIWVVIFPDSIPGRVATINDRMSLRERTRRGLGIIASSTKPSLAQGPTWSVFDAQTKSNAWGDCVPVFLDSPGECVAIGHKTATTARECCTS